MRLLLHEELMIPLPPNWVLSPEREAVEGSLQTIALGPTPSGEFRPNIVVSSEENLLCETVESFARRILDSLQSSLTDFEIREKALVVHGYLPVYRREYEFSTVARDGRSFQILQVQYYILVFPKIFTLTFSGTEDQFSDLKTFAEVMLTRLRIREVPLMPGTAW